MFKIQRWDMQRTKCFNLRLSSRVFGFQFNRNFSGNLDGKYLGVSIVIETRFRPWRIPLFIPSIYACKHILKDFFTGLKKGKAFSYGIYKFNYFKSNM